MNLICNKKSLEIKQKIDQMKTIIKKTTTNMFSEMLSQQIDFLIKLEQIEDDLNDKLNSISSRMQTNQNNDLVNELNAIDFNYRFISQQNLSIGILNKLHSQEEINEQMKESDETNSEIESESEVANKTEANQTGIISYKTAIRVNKSIWQTITNKRRSYIARKELSTLQQEEINRLIKLFHKSVHERFQVKLKAKRQVKSQSGYYFQSRCCKCDASWSMRVIALKDICVINSHRSCCISQNQALFSQFDMIRIKKEKVDRENQPDVVETLIKTNVNQSDQESVINHTSNSNLITYELKAKLSKEIWQTLSNKPKRHYFVYNDLTPNEKEEISKLKELLSNSIRDKFKASSSYLSGAKVANGYIMTYRCNGYSKHKCNSKWVMNVNVPSQTCKIKANYICRHLK